MSSMSAVGLILRGSHMRILCLLAVVIALFLPASAQDNSETAAVSKIIALEKAWNQAFKSRDLKAIDALLDDRAVLVNDDGSLQTKGAFLAAMRESKPSDEQQVSPESISVRLPRLMSCAVEESASAICVAILNAPANAAFGSSNPGG